MKKDKPGSPGIEAMNPTTRPDVKQLTQAWQAKAGDVVTGAPIVDEQAGRVYFGDWGGNVYAVKLSDGSQVWKKQITKPAMKAPWHGFTGTGVMADGTLFFATSDNGTAYAINPQDGSVLWEKNFAGRKTAGNIGELGYHDGKLFIGVASYEELLDMKKPGFEPMFQGKVVALDISNGSVLWERALAPNADGAGVWSGFAVDDASNTLFFTTSNNYTKVNELSDAIVAVDAASGEIKWSLQVTPNDRWTKEDQVGPDYAFAAPPLFVEAGGRKMVVAGDKSGRLFGVDAETGEAMWTTVVGYGGFGGGIHGTPAYDNGTVYVWSNNSYDYKKPAAMFPLDVAAVDAATGDYKWMNATVQPASTTGGGVVAAETYFTPCIDGIIRGYRTSDGKVTHAAKVPQGSPVSTTIVHTGNRLLAGAGLPKMFSPNPGSFRGIVAWDLR